MTVCVPFRLGRALVAAFLAAVMALALAGPGSAATGSSLVLEGVSVDYTGTNLPEKWSVSSGGATNGPHAYGTETLAWQVPSAIPAGGASATLNLSVTGTNFAPVLGIYGAADFSGGETTIGAYARSETGEAVTKTVSTTVKITPRPGAVGSVVRIVVGLGYESPKVNYDYRVVGANPAVPAKPVVPKLTSPRVAPKLGVPTSYPAPKPLVPLSLPFPEGGCDVGASAGERARPTDPNPPQFCQATVTEERAGGPRIDEPDFIAAVEPSDKNVDKAITLCYLLTTDVKTKINLGNGRIVSASFVKCVTVVSRILQRNEEIKNRGKVHAERSSHAAAGCLSATARSRRSSSKPPLAVTCVPVKGGIRITMRPTLAGRSFASVLGSAPRLIVGRTGRVPARPGDRITVLWTATGPSVTPPVVTSVRVPLTSVEAFPNPRASNDPPANAIDANTGTFTWSTESNNVIHPSYLAVGFADSKIGRLRLWKDSNGGGGQNIKNLVIQYTTGTGPLSARAWTNVAGLANGFQGAELLKATAVNADGNVTGDIHNSPAGDGYASLTFTPVQATGLRIAFANPNPATTCSGVQGTCNHYRVGEFEVYSGA